MTVQPLSLVSAQLSEKKPENKETDSIRDESGVLQVEKSKKKFLPPASIEEVMAQQETINQEPKQH